MNADKFVDAYVKGYLETADASDQDFDNFADSVLAPEKSELEDVQASLAMLKEEMRELKSQIAKLQVPRKRLREDHEVLIRLNIKQFLQSWSSRYRCNHHCNNRCHFDESVCFRIHDTTSHSTIASELRNLMLGYEPEFFNALVQKCAQFRCANVCADMMTELQNMQRAFALKRKCDEQTADQKQKTNDAGADTAFVARAQLECGTDDHEHEAERQKKRVRGGS
jgi:hypothetical protein